MISNKVIHLITTIERGGAEKQLLTLASEQVQSGIKVEVIFLKGKPELKKEFEESGVKVNKLLAGTNFLKQITLLSKYLRKNPSPVHAHLPKAELLAAIVVANKYFKTIPPSISSRTDFIPSAAKSPSSSRFFF